MQQKLHKNARTTLVIRKEIKESQDSILSLAKKYNLSWNTVRKWKNAVNLNDKTSRPCRLRTTLDAKQEEFIVLNRRQFKSTLEEIYFAFEKAFPETKVYVMKIYRCLKRYGLNVLPKEFQEAERRIKRFKKYNIGYVHIDLMHTKRLEGDDKKYYIFTCIDRVSKLAYVKLTDSKKIDMSEEFLREVLTYYPYRINYILTDNGMEFTYRGLRGRNRRFKPKREHPYRSICNQNKIELRHTKFYSPWTNGMVERFNRKIKENVVNSRYFKNVEGMGKELVRWMNKYNFETRLKGLNYCTPVGYLKKELNIREKDLKNLVQFITTYRY